MELLPLRKSCIAPCSSVQRVGHLVVSHWKLDDDPQGSPVDVPFFLHGYTVEFDGSLRSLFTGSVIEPDVSTSSIRFGLRSRASMRRVSVVCEMASGSTGSKSYV